MCIRDRPHTLQVTFAPLRAEEAEEMIDALPPLDGLSLIHISTSM